jgi:hypothetical protein
MFPIACVRLRTGYNEAGVIVPHKTEVAIALWRIAVSIANMFNNSTQPRCSNASGLFRSEWFRLIPNNSPNHPDFMLYSIF